MKTVLLLCGGKSDEHEISLISTKGILTALDRTRFQPLIVGISRDGKWFLEEEASFYTGEFRADRIKLNTQRPTVALQPFLEKGRGLLLAEGRPHPFDIAFPILHGPFGEDGTIQGLLEMTGIPYVGSDPGSSWICMDKYLAKTIVQSRGIKTPPFVSVRSLEELALQRGALERLGYPLFVKPCRLGSSVGISKVQRSEELRPAVEKALKFDTRCLIEQGIQGREIETAVLGTAKTPQVALPGEVIPAKNIGWYSYEAKYLLADGARIEIPAALDGALQKRAQKFAAEIFSLLECDGLARIDLFLETATDTLYFNEANTIPGFTPISMYPKMWEASGLPYGALITKLLELARTKVSSPPSPQG